MTHHMYLATPDATSVIYHVDTTPLGWMGNQLITAVNLPGIGFRPCSIGDETGLYDDPVQMSDDPDFPTGLILYHVVTSAVAAYFLIHNNDTGFIELWSVTATGVIAQDTSFPEDFAFGKWSQHSVDVQDEVEARIRAQRTDDINFGTIMGVQLDNVVSAVSPDDADETYASVWHGIIEADVTVDVPDQPDPVTPATEPKTMDHTDSLITPNHAGVFTFDPDTTIDHPSHTEWPSAVFSVSDAIEFPFTLWAYDATFSLTPVPLATTEAEAFDADDLQTDLIESAFFHDFVNGPDGNDHLFWNYIDPAGDGAEPTYGGDPEIGASVGTISWDHQPDDIPAPHLFPITDAYTFSAQGGATPETSDFFPDPPGPILGAMMTVAGWTRTTGGRLSGIPAPVRYLGVVGAIGSVAIHFFPEPAATGVPGDVRRRFFG